MSIESLHFLYHELRNAESSYSYVTPTQEFASHCELFARASKWTGDGRYQPAITFDDGNESDLTLAQPTLERYGLQATFFITAGWTERRIGFMRWSQLRALRAAGHRVGAHGMTHKLLTGCSPAELDVELTGARKRLEDGLGAAVQIISLPGGRSNKRVLQACEQAGYEQVYTSLPRAEDMACKPKCVGRLNLVRGTSCRWLERVLDPSTGVLTRLERTAQVKQAAKAILGDTLYARLWALGNRQETETMEAVSP